MTGGVRAVVCDAWRTLAALWGGKSGDVATSELYMELMVDRTSHQFMVLGSGDPMSEAVVRFSVGTWATVVDKIRAAKHDRQIEPFLFCHCEGYEAAGVTVLGPLQTSVRSTKIAANTGIREKASLQCAGLFFDLRN